VNCPAKSWSRGCGKRRRSCSTSAVQGATGQLDNNKRLQVIRKDIARIYTIMRERELGLSAAPTEVA
jgi:large subunit ribosomal protein L29